MSGKNRLVLVVDDERNVCELLRRWLESCDYRVKTAASASEALAAMLVEAAPIIFTDLMMPGHDGFWLIERVREKWPATVVIVASGVDEMTSVARSRTLGAIDYVLKPFGREMLWQAMLRANEALRVPA